MRRRVAIAAIAALVIVVAAGCRSAPPLRYYTLVAGEAPTAAIGTPLIGIRHLRVDPPYDQDRLVRVGVAQEVHFHDSQRWAAPLGRLLPLALAEELSTHRGIGYVEPAASGRHYDALLEGRLLQLAEVAIAGGSVARVRLELELSTPGGAVRWRGVVAAEVPVPGGDVGEAVGGLRRALQLGLDEVAPAIAAALARGTSGDEPEQEL